MVGLNAVCSIERVVGIADDVSYLSCPPMAMMMNVGAESLSAPNRLRCSRILALTHCDNRNSLWAPGRHLGQKLDFALLHLGQDLAHTGQKCVRVAHRPGACSGVICSVPWATHITYGAQHAPDTTYDAVTTVARGSDG